jgi:hypothetical protein
MRQIEPQHALHVIDYYLWRAMQCVNNTAAWDFWHSHAARYADGEEDAREGW